MKKMIAMLTALALVLSLGVTALAESDFSYEGIVVAGDTVPIAAPFGGRLDGVTARAGSWVAQGDAVGSIKTTLNYAPIEGTVTGLYAEEGDATEEQGGSEEDACFHFAESDSSKRGVEK